MKVKFAYDKSKDIWCLLNYGKGSKNSSTPTGVYQRMITITGESPSEEAVSNFIDQYLVETGYIISEYEKEYQKNWDTIGEQFEKVAEKVFGIPLDKQITAYLTINNRCPFNLQENWFMVTMNKFSPVRIAMHELWHFYTWYRFGIDWEPKLGAAKYNELKEALTVLINVECKDLLPEGLDDKGYPQHQELRAKILDWWKEKQNVDQLWLRLVTYQNA